MQANVLEEDTDRSTQSSAILSGVSGVSLTLRKKKQSPTRETILPRGLAQQQQQQQQQQLASVQKQPKSDVSSRRSNNNKTKRSSRSSNNNRKVRVVRRPNASRYAYVGPKVLSQLRQSKKRKLRPTATKTSRTTLLSAIRKQFYRLRRVRLVPKTLITTSTMPAAAKRLRPVEKQ